MPMKRHLYPSNWKDISKRIRARAKDRCECVRECGLHQSDGAPRRCIEVHGRKAVYAKGKVVLTVAHRGPPESDCRDENLLAMCQRCHLRYDLPLHMKNAAETRRLKREFDDRHQLKFI